MVSSMMLVAALVAQAPEPVTKEALAQRAAAERTRTLELRREYQSKQRAAALARRTLDQKKKDPRWMSTVAYITSDTGHQQPTRYVPLNSRSAETAQKLSDASSIAAHYNNAPTHYDVFFKDGSHEVYNLAGILVQRIPPPKKADND